MDPRGSRSQPQQYTHPAQTQGETPHPYNVSWHRSDGQPGPGQSFHVGHDVQQMDATLGRMSAQGIVGQPKQRVEDTNRVSNYPPLNQGDVQVTSHPQTGYHQRPFYVGQSLQNSRYTGYAFAGQWHPSVYRQAVAPSQQRQQQIFQVQQSQLRQMRGQNPTFIPAVDTSRWGLQRSHPHNFQTRFGYPDGGQRLMLPRNQQTQGRVQFAPQHSMVQRLTGSPISLGQVEGKNIGSRIGPGIEPSQTPLRYNRDSQYVMGYQPYHPMPQSAIHPTGNVNLDGPGQNPMFQPLQQPQPINHVYQSQMLPEQSLRDTEMGHIEQRHHDIPIKGQALIQPQPQPLSSQLNTTPASHGSKPFSDMRPSSFNQGPIQDRCQPEVLNHSQQASQTRPKPPISLDPNGRAQDMNGSLISSHQLNLHQERNQSPMRTVQDNAATQVPQAISTANQQNVQTVTQDPPIKVAKSDTVVHGRIQPSESGSNSSTRLSQESLFAGTFGISPASFRVYRHNQNSQGSSIPGSSPQASLSNQLNIQQGRHQSPMTAYQGVAGTTSANDNQRGIQPVTQGPLVKVGKKGKKEIKTEENPVKERETDVSADRVAGAIGPQYNGVQVPPLHASKNGEGHVDEFIKICNDFTASRTKDNITSMCSQLSVPEEQVHPGFVISKHYMDDTAAAANAYIPDQLHVDHKKGSFEGKKIEIHEWLDGVNFAALVGDAGAGKTTESKRFCQMVLNGEIPSLRHIRLVHFLTFVELDSAKKHTAFDLLFKHPLGAKLTDDSIYHGYKWVESHADALLLVIDGLDQVGWSLDGIHTSITYDQPASAPAIIHNILSKRLFPNCKVIIISREHAVRHFPADVCPPKIICLTGLSLKDREYLIRKFAGVKGDIVLNLLRTQSPGLLSLCEMPAFTFFSVVGILENLEDAPKTVSGILIRVLAHFLSQNVKEAPIIWHGSILLR